MGVVCAVMVGGWAGLGWVWLPWRWWSVAAVAVFDKLGNGWVRGWMGGGRGWVLAGLPVDSPMQF